MHPSGMLLLYHFEFSKTMTSIIPIKFRNSAEFINWIQTHADAQLSEILKSEPDEFTAEVQSLMERYSDMRGCYDMLKISGNLGQFVPEMLVATGNSQTLNSTEEKKAFILPCVLALFRLMNRGISGKEQNIFQNSTGGIPLPFKDSSSMEQAFVLPLAEQSFEQCSALLNTTY